MSSIVADQQRPHITSPIEEGRAASKSPHSTVGYFLSISQQEVFADIIQNSPQKQKEQRQKQLDVSFYSMLFFLTVYILPSLSAC
jgi:hypothetical protein